MKSTVALTVRDLLPCALVVLVVALGVSLVGDPTLTRVGTNFLVAVVLVLGVQLFSGNTGIVSFGHVAFMGIGAYVGAVLTIPPAVKQLQLLGLPPLLADAKVGFFVALVAAGLVAGLCAFVVGLALTRMKDNAIAMSTIALLVIFQVVASNWQGVTNGLVGVYGIPGSLTLWVAAILAVLVAAGGLWFRYSHTGLRTRGTREDSLAASAMGANVHNLRLVTWTISCVIMGVGGAAWASVNTAFTPDSFGFVQTFALLAMLVIGGMGSVSGAIAGAAILAVVNEVLRRGEAGFNLGSLDIRLATGWSAIVVAVIIICILIWRPLGIVGAREWGTRLSDIARRRRTREDT